jgi:transcriptional regulator with XRE-family HTH domain
VFIVAGNSKTTEVMRKIITAESVTKMLKATEEEHNLPHIGDYLDGLRREKELRKEDFFIIGGVSSTYGYEILRGAKIPSRDTLIRFALAFGLSVDETDYLLKIGGKAKLYPVLKRDALIIFGLINGMSVLELNIKAEEKGILPIGNY